MTMQDAPVERPWRRWLRRVGWAATILAVVPAPVLGLLRLVGWMAGCDGESPVCTPLGIDLGPPTVGSFEITFIWLAAMTGPLLLVAGATFFVGTPRFLPRVLTAGVVPPLAGLAVLFLLMVVGVGLTGPTCSIGGSGGNTPCVVWGAEAGTGFQAVGVLPWLLYYLLPLSALWVVGAILAAGIAALFGRRRRAA